MTNKFNQPFYYTVFNPLNTSYQTIYLMYSKGVIKINMLKLSVFYGYEFIVYKLKIIPTIIPFLSVLFHYPHSGSFFMTRSFALKWINMFWTFIIKRIPYVLRQNSVCYDKLKNTTVKQISVNVINVNVRLAGLTLFYCNSIRSRTCQRD